MLEIAWNAKKNMKYWTKNIFKYIFFQYLTNSYSRKFQQHSINIKNYTAHPHDMVHVPAKFRENTLMRFWVTVRKLNVTDGGRCNISRPGPSAPREIKNTLKSHLKVIIRVGRCMYRSSCSSRACTSLHLIELYWMKVNHGFNRRVCGNVNV